MRRRKADVRYEPTVRPVKVVRYGVFVADSQCAGLSWLHGLHSDKRAASRQARRVRGVVKDLWTELYAEGQDVAELADMAAA